MTKIPFPDSEKIALGDFRQFHIAIAESELARVRNSPSWRKYQTFTDNRLGKPARNVKLFGKIEYANENLAAVLEFIWRSLNEAADAIRDEGDYERSLRMYVPGAGTFTGTRQLPADATEVRFYPLVPYARKVELGQSSAAPRGVFKPTYQSARRLYGRNAQIYFTYKTPREGFIVNRHSRGFTRSGARRKVNASFQASVPVPEIVVRQGGFFQ